MKTKLKSLILVLLPAATFASVSNGPYVGLEVGAANQIINFTPNAFNLSTNGSGLYNTSVGFIGRLNLGYNVDQYSGFELGGNYNFGTGFYYPSGNSSMNITATTIDASYILSIPTVIRKFSIFGRVGLAYDSIGSSGDVNCGCGSSNSLANPSGSAFADILGAGLRYSLSPNSSVRIEWISNGLLFPIGISSGSQNIANWSEQTFQIGLNYHF